MSVLGAGDAKFVAEMEKAGADVSTRRRKDTDIFVLGVDSLSAMSKLAGLEPFMSRNGAIWVVHPKGRKDVAGSDVIRLGVHAGFVDNKTCAFSATHTALRFVIPLARR